MGFLAPSPDDESSEHSLPGVSMDLEPRRCPSCRTEHPPWVAECPTCQVPTVPPTQLPSSDDLPWWQQWLRPSEGETGREPEEALFKERTGAPDTQGPVPRSEPGTNEPASRPPEIADPEHVEAAVAADTAPPTDLAPPRGQDHVTEAEPVTEEDADEPPADGMAADEEPAAHLAALEEIPEPEIFAASVESLRRYLSEDRELRRTTVVQTLHGALESLPYVQAMWLGGADAFGRVDRYSDIDLYLDVDDDRTADAFEAVEATLDEMSGIEAVWHAPEPTWHGYEQRIYRLVKASPYLLVDLVVRQASQAQRFTEIERYGEPFVVFDRLGVIEATQLDRGALETELEERLAELKTRIPLLHVLVDKELLRNDPLGAIEMFRQFAHGPLIELVRIRWVPDRWDFGLRYAKKDLPPSVWRKLERLLYVADMDDLRDKWLKARKWMLQLLTELAPDEDE